MKNRLGIGRQFRFDGRIEIRERHLLAACLALVAGIYAPQLSSFALHSGLIPVAVILLGTARLTGRPPLLLFMVAGAALFAAEARGVIDNRISPRYVGDSIMTDVRVIEFPQRRGTTVSFIGEVHDSPWVPNRIRVSWFNPADEILLGDVWRLELRLKRPRGTSNPGVFDYEGWLFRMRVLATGFVVDSRRNERIRMADFGPVERYRQRVVRRLLATIDNPDRAAVLAAISVGARHLVSRDQWQKYARTGTSHLMAISGLHVGMVAVFAYFLTAVVVGLTAWSRQQHRLGTLAAFLAAAGYALVSGTGVPALRATMMIGLAAAAVLCARQARAFRIVALTSAVLAGAAPLTTMSAGFMLSFLAVIVLIWLARQTPGVQTRSISQRWAWRARRLLQIQLALLLGLLPVTVLLFDRVAFAAPFVNLGAVPIFSMVTVPFTMFGLLLDGPAQPAGDAMLEIASRSLDGVERLIDTGLWLPSPADPLPAVRGWSWFLLFVPAAWTALPAGWPGRSLAWLAALAVVATEPARPEPACAEITVIDVGQGLAIAVQTQTRTLLYDTGPSYYSGGNAAEAVIVPYLRSRGVRSLDDLVISHADLDHSGGLATIVREFGVRRIHVGESAGSSWLASPCIAGSAWTYDSVRFEFLHPRGIADWTGNNASCVLQVSAGSSRVLISGDIERAAESELVAAGNLSPVDAVIVPHHGSRTSSTPRFVDLLRPKLAVVSAGYGNRWGQPAPKVVDRWRAAGATVLTTARSGAISLTVCAHGGLADLDEHRLSLRRLWHE